MPRSRHDRVYVDTSFVVSLFIDDAFTEDARRLVETHHRPLMISPLLQLEYQTAVWQLVARGTLVETQAISALGEFERQQGLGRFLRPDIAEESVWEEAARLSDRHTAVLHLRSLDILHVAFAILGQANRFWSFDDRQRRLAEATGLWVNR